MSKLRTSMGIGFRVSPRVRFYVGTSRSVYSSRRPNAAANRGPSDLLLFGCLVPLIILGCLAFAGILVIVL